MLMFMCCILILYFLIFFFFFIFFLMIRRPPRSTLFPYTSSSDLAILPRMFGAKVILDFHDLMPELRSEEHTSELQSLTNLVCRLLLEKKKKQQKEVTGGK